MPLSSDLPLRESSNNTNIDLPTEITPELVPSSIQNSPPSSAPNSVQNSVPNNVPIVPIIDVPLRRSVRIPKPVRRYGWD